MKFFAVLMMFVFCVDVKARALTTTSPGAIVVPFNPPAGTLPPRPTHSGDRGNAIRLPNGIAEPFNPTAGPLPPRPTPSGDGGIAVTVPNGIVVPFHPTAGPLPPKPV